MNRLLAIFSAFLLTAIAEAQSTGVIRGVVSDAITEAPIASCKITSLEGVTLGFSKLDGSFEIKTATSQAYFEHPDFVKKSIELKFSGFNMVSLMPLDAQIDEVNISTKKDDGTELSARLSEKTSLTVKNIISSQEIDVSPDITVANVIQRVSGISIERNNNGDGQHAIVRGMDKRYNYTLVNGIKIPSPDNKNRYVPLDIFPSDLLDRLEVTKALTPNMEGDAIGGVVDMKLKDAPNRKIFNVNVGTGYSQLFLDRDYRSFETQDVSRRSPHAVNGTDYRAKTADFLMSNLVYTDGQAPLNQLFGLSMGNRFMKGRLGGILALSYQNTYRGANSMFMSTFIQPETNTPYYEIMQLRKFSAQQRRTGVHTKWDYKFSNRSQISLYAAYIGLLDREVRDRVDTILKIGRGQGPGTGRVELRNRSRQKFQDIYNATLQGKHQLGGVKMDWSAVYSLAIQDDPDMAQFALLTEVLKDSAGNFIDKPDVIDRDFTRRWVHNSDQDIALYYNASYLTKLGESVVDFSAGGLYRMKNRSHEFNSYLFRNVPVGQVWTGSPYNHTWELFNTLGTPTDPLNYDCNENVLGLYGMAKWEYLKWQALGGVRFENTAFDWETQAPKTVNGRTGSIRYSDLLPSIHIKYLANNNMQVRSSYFASISRPSFYEVIPYEINEEDFRERGNPFLRRTQAHNFDLRLEHFSKQVNKFMVGAFYKKIINPIESALVITGQTVYAQPNNFGTAFNYGVEVDASRYFGNFGIRGFYTFTNSSITTSKIVKFRNDQGSLTQRNEDQTRPLQGQSKHIFNASLLYKNTKTGTDIQLSGVYTGQRIMTVSPYLNNDVWQRAYFIVDFSIEQKVAKNWFFYAKLNNLLNTPMRADILLPNTFNPEQAPYLDASSSVLVREDFYGQTYFAGIKFKFL
ncbi:MAG: TonB-dependent receptor [Bacteroidia bacterium]|nr:TonB-dependent receptor [Bacteroidia bacterium]